MYCEIRSHIIKPHKKDLHKGFFYEYFMNANNFLLGFKYMTFDKCFIYFNQELRPCSTDATNLGPTFGIVLNSYKDGNRQIGNNWTSFKLRAMLLFGCFVFWL